MRLGGIKAGATVLVSGHGIGTVKEVKDFAARPGQEHDPRGVKVLVGFGRACPTCGRAQHEEKWVDPMHVTVTR